MFALESRFASTHSDMIPEEYCDALSKLRSNVAPMDTETVHAQIEKHLGAPTDELFAFFDDNPLGSASIGQVHRQSSKMAPWLPSRCAALAW
ncbi:MAG: AarF/UbiB family protein [Atopobiaceae bacterium]|nr:AarF/UbiB family protein [Atopobiaceae bacterium]